MKESKNDGKEYGILVNRTHRNRRWWEFVNVKVHCSLIDEYDLQQREDHKCDWGVFLLNFHKWWIFMIVKRDSSRSSVNGIWAEVHWVTLKTIRVSVDYPDPR